MANKVIMLDLSWFDMLCDGGLVEWREGELERMNRQKQLQKWLRNWHGSFKAALSAPNDACRSPLAVATIGVAQAGVLRKNQKTKTKTNAHNTRRRSQVANQMDVVALQ